MPTLEIAYGDAGWNPHSSSIGNFSLETLPKTSEEEHTWTTGDKLFFLIASRTFAVPWIFVSNVSSGESKLVWG